MGIDSAKNRVDAVALVDGKIVAHRSIDYEPNWVKASVPRPLALKLLQEGIMAWLAELPSPVGIWVEDAILVKSARTAIHLGQTVGMLLALPYPATEVPIDSWKKVAVGRGGASKGEVHDAIVARFPETPTLFGKRQDLFDAAGVAVYGHSLGRT